MLSHQILTERGKRAVENLEFLCQILTGRSERAVAKFEHLFANF